MANALQDRLKSAVAALQTFADDVDAKDGGPTGDDIAALKDRMEEIKGLRSEVEADADRRNDMASAKSFLAGLGAGNSEETPAAPVKVSTSWGAPMDPKGKTFGEIFLESEGYKDFMGRYGRNGLIPNQVKGVQSAPISLGVEAKDLVTGVSSTSGGAFVTNDRLGSVVDLIGERELTIADLVTKGSTTSDTVEYVRVTGRTNNAATVAEATTAAMPATYGDPASGVKPESALAFDVVTTTVKTLAHWIPITKRAASDAGQVRTLIDNFLRVGLNEVLEDQILKGNGTGENFAGILGSGVSTVGSAGTDIDAVVDAIAAVRRERKRPTAMVVHPDDWYSNGFLTAKDSNGNYLVGDPRASIDQLNTLWGLRVVVSEAMTVNTALVGDFSQAVLWNREAISLLVSDQHADFFTRNLLAILAEMRAAFGVLDPKAFCTVTAI